MAFMGIFMMWLVIFLVIIGFFTFVGAVLVIVSIAMSARQKKLAMVNSMNGMPYVPSKKYMIPRVIGILCFLPLVGTILLIVYSVVSTKISNYNSLWYNVDNGNYSRAETLLEKGISPDCTVDSNDPAKDGEQTILSVLCENGGFSDGFDDEETEEELAMIQLLIDYGADIEYVSYRHEKSNYSHTYSEEQDYYQPSDGCGYTPLLYAVRHGNTLCVKLLVKNGADVNVSDYCGFNTVATVADNLSDEDGAEILQYLIEKGASTETVTNFGQTNEFLALRNESRGNEEIERILLQ
jgi:hypothetical protein